jgi:hypothetical protein
MWEYAFAWGRNGTIYKEITGRDATVNVKDYIASVGRDGWELCCTLPERDGYMLIFKRPTHE